MSPRSRGRPDPDRIAALIVALAAVTAFLLVTRSRPWWIPADAVSVGDVYVRRDLKTPLENARSMCPGVWAKCDREQRFVQGYGDAGQSNGTHRHGWCLDIATGRISRWTWLGRRTREPLSRAEIQGLVGALEEAGFAAPLRIEGYDLGGGLRVPRGAEHIHAVFHGHENYEACRNSTQPEGKAALDKMLRYR